MPGPTKTNSTVIPCLRYRDALAAIDWFVDVIGFERRLVVPNPDGTIAHAELFYGGGMIMLGTAPSIEFGEFLTQPREIDGMVTQTGYIVVDDADVVCDRVKASGCVIVIDVKDEDYGGRSFTCRDLELNVWTFGTYNPWASH